MIGLGFLDSGTTLIKRAGTGTSFMVLLTMNDTPIPLCHNRERDKSHSLQEAMTRNLIMTCAHACARKFGELRKHVQNVGSLFRMPQFVLIKP